MKHSLFAFTIGTVFATGAFAQHHQVPEIKPPFWREYQTEPVTIPPGGFTQVIVNCTGGYILSAGAFTVDTDNRYTLLDVSNVQITTVSSALIYAYNRDEKEYDGDVLAFAVCIKSLFPKKLFL